MSLRFSGGQIGYERSSIVAGEARSLSTQIATLTLPDFKDYENRSENMPKTFGSGPKGRRFESSRPDQIPNKTRRIQSIGPLGFNRVVSGSNPFKFGFTIQTNSSRRVNATYRGKKAC
jgi:hypothetical protein